MTISGHYASAQALIDRWNRRPDRSECQELQAEVERLRAGWHHLRVERDEARTEVERLRIGGAPGGAGMIAAERKRQIDEEGWSAEHDDRHTFGELACAAACYTLTHKWRRMVAARIWPWRAECFKPKDRVYDLVRAGALIAAEIDRLQRIKDSD